MQNIKIHRIVGVLAGLVFSLPSAALASLPPPDDIPEEVLRSQFWLEEQSGEIILERSPQTGQALKVPEIVDKQKQSDQPEKPEVVLAPEVQTIITLLRLRQLWRSLLPF
jgi:hypothetical protein